MARKSKLPRAKPVTRGARVGKVTPDSVRKARDLSYIGDAFIGAGIVVGVIAFFVALAWVLS